MNDGYFHRVHKETPTRFWINNPTLSEAVKAIEAGAEYCTTNPTYSIKMLNNPEMKELRDEILPNVLKSQKDDGLAASAIQSQLTKRIMDIFYPIYKSSGGTKGWVSIQGDPEKEDDPSCILKEAEENLKLGKNYIAKVPVTESGIEAISELASSGVPIIATEVMSLSQAVQVCEAYVQAISGKAQSAPLYLTHITGIFDQHLEEWKKESKIDIDDDILRTAGFLAGKEQYRVIKERNYPVTMLGGGARGLHHFTDFVGADMHLTINWKGTADRLISENTKVVDAFHKNVDPKVLEELLEKVPVFKAAWFEDGLSIKEYGEYPPVILFRSMFLDGWRQLKDLIKENRNE